MTAQEPEVRVRMTHPTSDGSYDARPEQVEFLKASGWELEDPDAEYERWPAELQPFEGQRLVRMRHPNLDAEIEVPESAVPQHRSNDWVLAEEAEAESLEAKTVEELKELARTRDLPVSGTKAELLERLQGPAEPEQDDDDQPAGPASQESEE